MQLFTARRRAPQILPPAEPVGSAPPAAFVQPATTPKPAPTRGHASPGARSRQLPGVYVRSDAVRKHLAGMPVQQRGADSLYTPEMTQKTYKRLVQLGSELASQGYNIILDAKFDRVATRQLAIAQAAAHQLPLTIVHCEAPLATLQQRVKERSGDIADATLAILEKQHLEPFTPAEQPYVTTIDTTQPLSPQLATIV